MRTLKTFFALIVSIPFLYMPIDWALDGRMNKEAGINSTLEKLEYKSAVVGSSEWMTSSLSLRVENSNIFNSLFTYEEVESLKAEGWSIPTLKEMVGFLESVGFNQKPGEIPLAYYQINWQYDGYIDPILGEVDKGEKMHVWVADEGGNNCIIIDKDELSFRVGKTLHNSKLSARLIRK